MDSMVLVVFTKEEAEVKIGKKVEVQGGLLGVPDKTRGKVWRIAPPYRCDYCEGGECNLDIEVEVDVEWELPTPPSTKRVGTFNRFRYQRFLKEIE